jgi:general secretion pathway protein L
MHRPTSPYQFFGLDLRQVWQGICDAWAPLLDSRFLGWLNPRISVRLLRADGSEAFWMGGGAPWRATSRDRADFEAIELAEEWILRRLLNMPEMPELAIREAVELDVHLASPFNSGDLVWGYAAPRNHTKEGRQVEVVITSRKHADHYLQSQRSRLLASKGADPEVWIVSASGVPIVLAGWGEARRARKTVAHRRIAVALALSAMCLAAVIAVSPSLQLRARSLEAIDAFEKLQRDTGAAVANREVFTGSLDRLNALRDLLAERVEPLQVMAVLTKALPDDTYLQGLQIQGLTVTVNGLTTDSAALIQTLASVPGFKEVKAPQAATRMAGANAENFRLEILLDPAYFSIIRDAEPPAPVSLSGSTVPTGSATSSGAPTPASAASTPAVPASEQAGPRKSRFTMGG